MAARRPEDWTTQEKKDLVEDSHHGVTLDGEHAVVCGYLKDFAHVMTMEGHGVDFSWGTVEHVLSTSRAFKS